MLSNSKSSLAYRVHEYVVREVNFFRVHLLFFLIVPLIAAAVFYGANGRFHIRESRCLSTRQFFLLV